MSAARVRSFTRRLTAVLGAAALLGCVAAPAAAQAVANSGGQPVMPMLLYGAVSVQGGGSLSRGSVQGLLAGGEDGAPVALSSDGSFGALGGPYLEVAGTTADAGQAVAFTVNGVQASATLGSCLPGSDPGPGVAWEAGLVCAVTLSVPAASTTEGVRVSTDLPAAQVGSPYSQQLQASGGREPYTWSVDVNSTLPSGLSLSSTGLLSGTPAAAGPTDFVVDVSDGQQPPLTAAQPLGLLVVPAGVAIGASSAGSTTSNTAPATAGGAGSGTAQTTVQGSGGPGTVLTADYPTDPETTAPAGASGTVVYFDVAMTADSAFQSVTIERCGIGAGAQLYWWNAAVPAWAPVSSQGALDAQGCITATLDSSSTPNLGELTGTPFAASAAGVPAAPAGGSTGGGATPAPTGSAGGSLPIPSTPPAATPVVSALSPGTGPVGTTVRVTGSGFTGVTAVRFGSQTAQFTVNSDTQLTATAPEGSGSVAVTVVTPQGTSAATAATDFAYVPTFSDVPSTYWAHTAIESLAADGILAGFPDGTFRPDAGVTRAQFVKTLDLGLGIKPLPGVSPFADVPASAWFAPYVAAAVKAGIVQGVSPTLFDPNATLTREEMSVLLARALHLSTMIQLQFSDRAHIDPWALAGVEQAFAAGLVSGFPDGSFQPLGTATRAQAAQVLALVAQRQAAQAQGSAG